MINFSKPLGTEDVSAVEFVKEMLAGDPVYAINFDRIQWDSKENKYVIVEFLLCEERQLSRGVTPYTSHPNRYFHKNARKFISLWKIARDLGAKLYLVNYAKKGTACENEVLLMEVLDVDEKDLNNPVKTKNLNLTRVKFSACFRELNNRGAID